MKRKLRLNRRYPGQNSNPEPSKYEAGVVAIQMQIWITVVSYKCQNIRHTAKADVDVCNIL